MEAKIRYSVKIGLYQLAHKLVHLATFLSFVDQHQVSPCGINTLSSRYVERIKTVIKINKIFA